MTIQLFLFYLFSLVLIFSALAVILVPNPVQAVLLLITSFVSSSVLWLLLDAEFLALILIVVYVGAVMTLFLFIVMMLNPRLENLRPGFVRYAPFALLLIVSLVFVMFLFMDPLHLHLETLHPMTETSSSNTVQLGLVLYTQYLVPFELAGVILLVSIIAAIALAFRKKRSAKSQQVSEQIQTSKSSRLRVIHLKSRN